MKCRSHCGACCIAPSINLPLPNMPEGKPAGVPCANLDLQNYQCRIWSQDNYPSLCAGFQAEIEVCGASRGEAIRLIGELETRTAG